VELGLALCTERGAANGGQHLEGEKCVCERERERERERETETETGRHGESHRAMMQRVRKCLAASGRIHAGWVSDIWKHAYACVYGVFLT
jgi:hypothetical protein